MAKLIQADADFVIEPAGRAPAGVMRKAVRSISAPLLRKAATRGRIDCPIWIKPKRGALLALRMVAIKEAGEGLGAARGKARRNAQKRRISSQSKRWKLPIGSSGDLTQANRLHD